MNRFLLFLVFLTCFSHQGFSQFFTVKGSTDYNFYMYLPDGYNDSIGNFPLIIFLHGKSVCGTDLNRVFNYGPLYEIKRGMKLPFVIIAPQTPCDKSWQPDKINNLLNYVLENYKVDSNRVYVTGMSLGGYGTLHFVGKYANRVAAAAAMCGGGHVEDACNMKDLPLWIFHGMRDYVVPITESQKMVDAINACGGDKVKFTIHPTYDHGQPSKYFGMMELYDWFLSNERTVK